MQLLALLFLAAAAWGQKADEFSLTVDQFKGQNTYIDSSRLQNNSAQSAVNVLTERGYVEKRTGNVLAGTFGAEVKNLHEYVKSSGSRLLMAHSGDYVKKTDLGTTATIVSTVVANGHVDFVSAFNKVVFVDAYSAVEYDGASTATVQGAPGCSLVEFDQNRLWCANIIAESQSMIRISSAGGTGYWTVPANVSSVADAPNLFYIQRDDGQAIKCLKKTPWGMVAGKRNSMWIVKGYDNRNWYILNIDQSVGCTDDRSMQMVDGRLQWLGTDGVYSWTGSGPAKLESLEVDTTIKSSRQSASQKSSWALDGQSDWLGGVFDFSGPGAKMSATISPGSITPSTWTMVDTSSTDFSNNSTLSDVDISSVPGEIRLASKRFYDNFSDGTYTGGPTWTVTAGSFDASGGFLKPASSGQNVIFSTSSVDVGSFKFRHQLYGHAVCDNLVSSLCFFVKFMNDSSDNYYQIYVGGATLNNYKRIYLIKYDGSETVLYDSGTKSYPVQSWHDFEVVRKLPGTLVLYLDGELLASVDDTAVTASTKTIIQMNNVDGTGENWLDTVDYSGYYSSGSFVSRILNTTLSTPTAGPFVSTYTFSIGEGQVDFFVRQSSSQNNDMWGPFQAASDTLRLGTTQQFWQYKANLYTSISTKTPTISTIELSAATTGWYLSPVHFVGVDISSWGSFDVNQTLPGASSVTYQIRQATFTFSSTNTAISWNNQQPNQTISAITVSTPTYFQWRSLLLMDSSTAYPSISLVRTNWDSGEPGSQVASGVLNHRYFLCLAISSSVNDTCLIQQQTRDWVIFDGPYESAMALYNNELLSGGFDSTGKVWRKMQSGVYNDDGTAISAHWTSPDYMFGDPVSQKVVSEMWLDANTSTGTIMNIGYSVDKSTTLINKALDLGSAPDVVNRRVPIASGFALGKYFRLKFSNAQDKYFRINGFTIFGQKKPRIE